MTWGDLLALCGIIVFGLWGAAGWLLGIWASVKRHADRHQFHQALIGQRRRAFALIKLRVRPSTSTLRDPELQAELHAMRELDAIEATPTPEHGS